MAKALWSIFNQHHLLYTAILIELIDDNLTTVFFIKKAKKLLHDLCAKEGQNESNSLHQQCGAM